MTPMPVEDKKSAAAHRDAMRRRARRIRRSVAGLALALFATAFLFIYVQLASGHDPALQTKAKKATLTESSTALPSGEESSGMASTSGEEASEPVSPVTTSQS